MKFLSLFFSLFLLSTIQLDAQTSATVIDSFAVSGNCGMCQNRIEKTAKSQKGVVSAAWDADTQRLTVQFDPAKITLDEIRQKIAAVGHDTDKFRAPDAVYEDLPGCCQYDRVNN